LVELILNWLLGWLSCQGWHRQLSSRLVQKLSRRLAIRWLVIRFDSRCWDDPRCMGRVPLTWWVERCILVIVATAGQTLSRLVITEEIIKLRLLYSALVVVSSVNLLLVKKDRLSVWLLIKLFIVGDILLIWGATLSVELLLTLVLWRMPLSLLLWLGWVATLVHLVTSLRKIHALTDGRLGFLALPSFLLFSSTLCCWDQKLSTGCTLIVSFLLLGLFRAYMLRWLSRLVFAWGSLPLILIWLNRACLQGRHQGGGLITRLADGVSYVLS
jgi:hypothetical protein